MILEEIFISEYTHRPHFHPPLTPIKIVIWLTVPISVYRLLVCAASLSFLHSRFNFEGAVPVWTLKIWVIFGNFLEEKYSIKCYGKLRTYLAIFVLYYIIFLSKNIEIQARLIRCLWRRQKKVPPLLRWFRLIE